MPPSQMPHRIDTHAHMLPPFYRQACLENGYANPDGMPKLPEWSPEAHLALMQTHNISKSILSISSPGTHLVANNPKLAADLTRKCNSYAAGLKRQYPQRFGYFASLPIPEVDICLREIETCIAEGCDGFVMMTNGYGVYPGSPELRPVFDELDRRGAVVFFHPTTPFCSCSTYLSPATTGLSTLSSTSSSSLLSNSSAGKVAPAGVPRIPATPLAPTYPIPFFEFLFDTARLVINLFMSGTMRRNPNLRIILPHLAGTLPPLLSRFTLFSSMIEGPWGAITEDEVRAEFSRRVWFDLAGVPFPGQLKGFLAAMGVGAERLLYGSDYPFTPESGVEMLVGRMDEGVQGLFEEGQIEDVFHRNAEKLLGCQSERSKL